MRINAVSVIYRIGCKNINKVTFLKRRFVNIFYSLPQCRSSLICDVLRHFWWVPIRFKSCARNGIVVLLSRPQSLRRGFPLGGGGLTAMGRWVRNPWLDFCTWEWQDSRLVNFFSRQLEGCSNPKISLGRQLNIPPRDGAVFQDMKTFVGT